MHDRTAAASSTRIGYRADIDGLRALAVLGVIFYHGGLSAVSGGFTGVDVFFVISGFLITSILKAEIEAGKFSILRFYNRRIRRIVPALLAVLAATLAAGWFLLTPADYRTLGESTAFAAFGLGNLYFFWHAGYFAAAAQTQPLLHTWSLGVEEQFYLVWPALLWASMMLIRSRRLFLWLFAAGLAVAFAYAERKVGFDPDGAFYLPHPRAWELAIGGILAFVPAIGAHRNLTTAVEWVGVALIGWSFFALRQADVFPGANALYACVGTALLLWPKAAPGPMAALLSLRPLRGIGLISYSLYLWHWPLLVFAFIKTGGVPPAALNAAMIALAFVLSALSYRFIETPVRRGRRLWQVLTLVALMAGAAAVGIVIDRTGGFEWRLPPAIRAVLAYQTYDFKADARVPQCWLDDKQTFEDFASECYLDPTTAANSGIVVWGDSHAARLYPGLRAVLGAKANIAQFTRNSCPAVTQGAYPQCLTSNEKILQQVLHDKPRTAILFAAWPNYSATWPSDFTMYTGLESVLHALRAGGVRNIILLGPAPKWTEALPSLVYQAWSKEPADSPIPLTLDSNLDPSANVVDARLRQLAQEVGGVSYVSVLDMLCDADGCLTRTPGSATDLLTWDGQHLTTAGATLVAKRLVQAGLLETH